MLLERPREEGDRGETGLRGDLRDIQLACLQERGGIVELVHPEELIGRAAGKLFDLHI